MMHSQNAHTMLSVQKQRKLGTKFWQVLDVVCVDDNGDPHVNKGRGKKIGDIFPAQVESHPGGTVVGWCHLATRLVQLFRY